MSQSLLSLTNHKHLSLFQVMNLLAQEHDNQTVINLTRKWCLDSESEDIQRISMEFLYMNGYYKDLQVMIHKNEKSQNPLNREWSKYYQLQLDQRLKVRSATEVIEVAEQMQTNSPELQCLIEFIKISAYYSLSDFAKIGNFSHDQPDLFRSIDDRLLVSYFTVRTYQNLFIYHWTRNEVIIARKYAYQILNQIIDLKVKTSLHINMALSYTFDTYSQAMYHLSEALKLSQDHNFHYYAHIIKNNNIPFISAHFNETEGITSQDKSEQAHLEIARGNYSTAIQLLEGLEQTDPFTLYYMGRAHQDEDLLQQSYHSFVYDWGDYFYARLPLNALRNMSY